MVIISFQNKFSGKELTMIVLESARESDLNIDFNKPANLPSKFKSSHIHLSGQIQNPASIYELIKKSVSIPGISCCFYLFDEVTYTNQFEFEIYPGLVRESKKGIRESDKNFIKMYLAINYYLGKFISEMKQRLNSSEDLMITQELIPSKDKFAGNIHEEYN